MGGAKRAGRRGRAPGSRGGGAEGRARLCRGALPEQGGPGHDPSRVDGAGRGRTLLQRHPECLGPPTHQFLYCCYRTFTINKFNLKYNRLCIQRKFWKDLGRKSLGQLVFILFQA